MKKSLISLILLLPFILIQTAQAQQSPTVRVVDVHGKGIPGVLVTGNLRCSNPIFPPPSERYFDLSAVTDQLGYYYFALPPESLTPICNGSVLTVTGYAREGYAFFNGVGVQTPLLLSVSAADYKVAAASEMIIAGFSTELALTSEAATSVPLPTTLAGRSVVIRPAGGVEKNAELLFASPTQINYIIPPGLPSGQAFVEVRESDRTVREGVIEIQRVAPSLFTLSQGGSGLPAAIVQRITPGNSVFYETIARFDPDQGVTPVPIDVDSETDMVFLALFGTGIRNRAGLESVKAKIGGIPVEVLFAGPQGMPGLDQINLRVPHELMGRGEALVEITVEGRPLNPVKIVIR